MSKFKKQNLSGMCICGHAFDRHHLGIIANKEAYEIMGPYLAQECEAFGFNEMGGLDEDGKEHCGWYIDIEDLEKQKEWKERIAKYDAFMETQSKRS
jgi:hypothetical protein